MTNFTKQITLYGSFFSDYIIYSSVAEDVCHEVSIELKSGGIWNLQRFIDTNYPEFKVFSDAEENWDAAFIIIDKARATKTSYVDRCGSRVYSIPDNFIKSDWHHIAYLDALPNVTPDQLEKLEGMVSFDLCMRNHGRETIDRIIECGQHADIVFMSDHEYQSIKCENIARVATIVHRADGSTTYLADGTIMETGFIPHTNVNVLGAGDVFAAAFICQHLLGHNLSDCLTAAHSASMEHVRNGN